jgi:hypothetical protein
VIGELIFVEQTPSLGVRSGNECVFDPRRPKEGAGRSKPVEALPGSSSTD